MARILRPNFFGFDTYKLHVKHSRLLLTKKGPRNDTRSPTIRPKMINNKNMRQLGARMKFKTLFINDEEKHGHILICFFNTFKQFLAPGGLSARCVEVSVM